jgi:CRISPR/Cas system-associated exonuclease Cas4 (RecB family)
MPFAGYICKTKGTVVSARQCERCARQGAPQACPMTAPVVAGMTLGIRKREGFTATELLGCLRKVRLKREHDYYLDPEELYWAFRGQLMHDVAKRWVRRGDEGAIAERRFAAKVFLDAEPISGQPDLIYKDRGHVVDYKTCRRLPGEWLTYRCQKCGEVMYENEFVIRKNVKSYACPHCNHEHDYAARQAGLTKSAPRARSSHVAQINVYAWILAQHDIAIRTGEIIYLDMGGMIRAPVEIWTMTRTAELVEQAYNALLAKTLPDRITNLEDQWQCNYCPVRRICEGQEASLAKAA